MKQSKKLIQKLYLLQFSGFGQTGSYKDRPGYDIISQVFFYNDNIKTLFIYFF